MFFRRKSKDKEVAAPLPPPPPLPEIAVIQKPKWGLLTLTAVAGAAIGALVIFVLG